MQQEINTVDAGQQARAVAIRAKAYGDMYKHTYSNKQYATAQTFLDVLKLAYAGVTYLTPRKTCVTVKTTATGVLNKQAVKTIMLICEERGYKVRKSPQGINFNLMRNSL